MTHNNVAAEIGVNVRTLRRWRALPEFIESVNAIRKELFDRNRENPLASRDAQISVKMTRYELLKASLARSTELSDTYADKRIELAMSSELSRLDVEIAKDLGRYLLPPEPVVDKRRQKQDISCLTDDEMEVVNIIFNKICTHNPWMLGPANRPLSTFEIA